MSVHVPGAATPRSILFAAAFVTAASMLWAAELSTPVDAQARTDGWQIAEDAIDLQNPVTLTPAVAAKGADLFRAKCQRCHGRSGRGNGPDADLDNPPRDLTDGRRASRNPDGVLFYKIWNGRSNPRMPAFKTDITRDEVWTIVHYIKTLRVP